MMQEAVEQEEYRGFTVGVYVDEDPANPRTECDPLGTMVCFHKGYDLGDKHDIDPKAFSGWGDIERYLWATKRAVVVLPLYLYDHSGITMSTRVEPFWHYPEWDSMRVGFIYIDADKVREEYGLKRISKSRKETFAALLQAEVKEYNQFLTGQVYGLLVKDPDGDEIEACWGYYDEPDAMITEGKAIVDACIADVEPESFPKVAVKVVGEQFVAEIREKAEEATYEVAIGSPEWKEGKGEEHHLEIIAEACILIGTLVGVLKEGAKEQKRLEAARATHGIWKDLPKEASNE